MQVPSLAKKNPRNLAKWKLNVASQVCIYVKYGIRYSDDMRLY